MDQHAGSGSGSCSNPILDTEIVLIAVWQGDGCEQVLGVSYKNVTGVEEKPSV